MLDSAWNFPDTLNIYIENRRAPTDDSVRIFHEMREQVVMSILAAGREDIDIGMLKWVLIDKPEYCGADLEFTITVNGTEFQGNVRMDRKRVMGLGTDAHTQCDIVKKLIIEEVRVVVVRAITEALIRQAASKIASMVIVNAN